jgi:hypothetical protein
VRYLKTLLITLVILFVPVVAFAAPASDIGTAVCKANPGAAGCGTMPLIGGPNSVFGKVIGVVIFVVGAVSVLMIVIGGLRYTLSGGDAAGIRSAKDTILYALVGLVVSALAYAVVAFVIKAI